MPAVDSKAKRVTGHVKLITGKRGAVWYAKTRVPGRKETTRRIAPAHLAGGKPRAGALTKKQARDELDRILVEERRKVGEHVYERRPNGATFADAADEFIRYVRDEKEVGSKTLKDYRGVIDGYLLRRFGERPLQEITREDIEGYRNDLKAKGKALRGAKGRVSNRVIVRHLTVLNGIFTQARRKWHGLPENPASAAMVDRPPVVYSGEFKVLDADTVRLVASYMPTQVGKAAVITAAFSGIREGEVLGLKWMDADFALERIQVRRAFTDGHMQPYPKSKKVRSTPMVPEVVQVLDGLSKRPYLTDPDDPVFPNAKGNHGGCFTLLRHFRGALKAAGQDPTFRFHDLRHTFGTLAVQAWHPSKVQGYMGHAHYSTTERYIHHTPATKDAASLQAVLDGNTLSRTLSRNGQLGGNSDQLSDTQSPVNTGEPSD